ncbi:MAG: Wzz/FepE/Etk N-terminal domain-containing protein [Kofleriaceae bacterium]
MTELGAVDPLDRLRRRWVTVLAPTIVGTLLAVTYIVYAAPRYEARLTVVPAQPHTGAVPSVGQSAALLVELGLDSAGIPTSGNRIAAILQSRSVSDAVIEQLHLQEHYRLDYIEQVRTRLWTACPVTVDHRSDVVSVTCQDESPEVARDLAQRIGQFGADAFDRVSTTTQREERTFLERQVYEARHLADETAQRVLTFQETHRILDLGEQAKTVVSMIATLQQDRIAKQLALAYVTTFASAHEANAAQLEQQLRILERMLRSLIDPAPQPSTQPTLFPPALELPRIGFDFAQLVREQRIREAVYLALVQRLELTKADGTHASTFQTLDEPVLPTMQVSRLRTIPVGAVIGLVLGLLIVLVPAWWKDLARRAAEEAAEDAA